MPASRQPTVQEQHPDTWIPAEVGDVLDGEVIDVTSAWSDQRFNAGRGGWYPLLQVRTNTGKVLAFHAFTTVSFNEVMEKQPTPGERIKVTYEGESAKSKPGQNAPRIFRLEMPDRDPRVTARNVYGKIAGASRSNDNPPTREVADPGQFELD